MLRKGTTFRIQKILLFLLFIASFRTQRNWSFPCFLTHSVLKGIGRFHVSWHFPYSKDLVVSHVYSYIPYSKNLVVSMFLDTFRIQEIWSFPCFLTHSIIIPYSKNLVVSMFLDTFRIQRIWSLFLFIDTFGIQGIWSFLLYSDTFHVQKCLETVKQNPWK